jgi:hypothetical protein
LRCYLDENFELKVLLAQNPVSHGWNCAKNIFSKINGEDSDPWNFKNKILTRSEYEENGLIYCQKRFNNYWKDEENILN